MRSKPMRWHPPCHDAETATSAGREKFEDSRVERRKVYPQSTVAPATEYSSPRQFLIGVVAEGYIDQIVDRWWRWIPSGSAATPQSGQVQSPDSGSDREDSPQNTPLMTVRCARTEVPASFCQH